MTPTTTLRRAMTTLAVTLLVLIGLAAPAAAQTDGSSGNDNTAIAVNTKDGSSLFKFAFSIARANGEVVDAGNAAVSYASCTDCQTVSIAIQFVIVAGSPDVFAPENVAIAVNDACSLCDTLATAYQFVIQTSGPVHLTADGQRQLQDLVKQIRELGKETLTIEEIQARVDTIADAMYEVMKAELVPAGPPQGPETESAPASTTTTTSRDSASTTSTTEAVRSSTTSSPSTSTTVGSSSTTVSPPPSTTTSEPATTTTTAP